MSFKNNQSGFAPIFILLVAVVVSVLGFAVWRVADKNNEKPLNNQQDVSQSSQLSPEDATILEKAKQLKKIDFDLDGTINSQDIDDDNDGISDEQDKDDDNDGQDDEVDTDDDNDGTDDEKDDESTQESD